MLAAETVGFGSEVAVVIMRKTWKKTGVVLVKEL